MAATERGPTGLKILGEIGKNKIGAGTADGEEGFVAGLFEIEPALLCGLS